ncbi:MAG: hypothetical protein JJ896_15200 [Rhodothermales bacterium]|nr:hypothetical protein [Rhodothermales bacterium]MBO6781000.1 hypothetical protein [Rhodothermales bacterium]
MNSRTSFLATLLAGLLGMGCGGQQTSDPNPAPGSEGIAQVEPLDFEENAETGPGPVQQEDTETYEEKGTIVVGGGEAPTPGTAGVTILPPRPPGPAGAGEPQESGPEQPIDCANSDNPVCGERSGWYCFETTVESFRFFNATNDEVEPTSVRRGDGELCVQLNEGQYSWTATTGSQSLDGEIPITVQAGEERQHGGAVAFAQTTNCADAAGLSVAECLEGLIDGGIGFFQSQNLEDATTAFRTVLEADPRNGRALYNLGVVLESRRMADELAATADNMIRYSGTFPDDRKAVYKAWASYFQGRAFQIRADRAIDVNNNNAARSHLIRAARELRDFEALVARFPPQQPAPADLTAAAASVPERIQSIEEKLRQL